MRIWEDNQPSTVATHPKPSTTQQKKMDYSNCPLKKRPVHYESISCENTMEENMDTAATDEPENLSTKPQDLRVKTRPTAAAATATATVMQTAPIRRQLSPSPAPHYQPHHNIATPPPSPAYQDQELQQQLQNQHQHQHQQPHIQPYQPIAIKPGPLEPLCLNIAAAAGDYAQQQHPESAAEQLYQPHQMHAYHNHVESNQHHNLLLQQQQQQQQQHQQRAAQQYAPVRPVPAQYPIAGYMPGYAYQQSPQLYPVGTVLVHNIERARDQSLSPPGATGSAFRPLQQHASPPAADTCHTVLPFTQPLRHLCPQQKQQQQQQQYPSLQQPSLCHNTPKTWYGRTWSAPQSPQQLSPPHTLSLPSPSPSTSSAVSPPYGPPQLMPAYEPPQLMPAYQVQQHQHQAVPENRNSKPVIAVATTTGTGGLRYKCGRCGKTYASGSGLTKHQQNHCVAAAVTVSPQPEAAALQMQQQQDAASKTFRCKYCDKAYNTLGALKMHIRTHTLPCICTMCGKAFSRPWLLQGHIRTHTGEKPFSCAFCNRAFADRSNLRAHLQTHSDVKKYSCPTCSKTFSRMSLLTKHCDTGCPRLLPQQQQQQGEGSSMSSPEPQF